MNKNIDDLDLYIKKCYDLTVIPDNIFNEAYKNLKTKHNKKRNKKNIYIGIAASISFILITFSIIKLRYYIKSNNINSKINIEQANNSENNELNNNIDSNVNLRASIDITPAEGIHSYMYFGEVEYVLVVRLDKILGSTCYIEDRDKYSYPITKVKATVLKDFRGNYNEKEVEFYIFGGKIPLSIYINLMDEEDKKRYNITNLTQEEINNTDANVNLMWVQNQAEAIVGKTYIVSLNYDETRYKSLRILPRLEEYNFKFYNLENNTYQDYTGEWKEVDLNNHKFYGIYDYNLKKWVRTELE